MSNRTNRKRSYGILLSKFNIIRDRGGRIYMNKYRLHTVSISVQRPYNNPLFPFPRRFIYLCTSIPTYDVTIPYKYWILSSVHARLLRFLRMKQRRKLKRKKSSFPKTHLLFNKTGACPKRMLNVFDNDQVRCFHCTNFDTHLLWVTTKLVIS